MSQAFHRELMDSSYAPFGSAGPQFTGHQLQPQPGAMPGQSAPGAVSDPRVAMLVAALLQHQHSGGHY